MASYDPVVIEKFARILYNRANGMIFQYAAVGGLACGVAGFFTGIPAIMICAVLLGLVVGYWMGSARAFTLKLQAQTALCQLQIEKNTRAAE